MKKLVLLLFIPLISFSQDYLVFVGDKSYPSTQIIEFENKEDDVYISFVKTDNGDALYIQTYYLFDPASIHKQLTLYLENGDALVSKKASKTDYVDKNCIAIYPLTKEDVSILKEKKLIQVRFTITQTYASGEEDDVNRFARTNEDIREYLKDF
tara:strand:+ start:222 stop:683 length:462 start_codon:yes stop_codon:yes gene_type:complete